MASLHRSSRPSLGAGTRLGNWCLSAAQGSSRTYRTRLFENSSVNSPPPSEPPGSPETDSSAAGARHVESGPFFDSDDAGEAALFAYRQVEVEMARTELELRREGAREYALRHKLWQQHATVLLVAVLAAAIALRPELSAAPLFVLLTIAGLITNAVFHCKPASP